MTNLNYYGFLKEIQARRVADLSPDGTPQERLAAAMAAADGSRAGGDRADSRPKNRCIDRELNDGDRVRSRSTLELPTKKQLLRRRGVERAGCARDRPADCDDRPELESLEQREDGTEGGVARLWPVERTEAEAALRSNVAVFVDAARPRASRSRWSTSSASLAPTRWASARRSATTWPRSGRCSADDPREANQDGGLFPAIFGTVLLVFLMAITCFPLGVLAGIYLGEYAKEGPLVRLVRVAVNNLAGHPLDRLRDLRPGVLHLHLRRRPRRLALPRRGSTPASPCSARAASSGPA